MSNVMIAAFFGLGAGAWIYSKMYSRTGGNNQSAITVAGLGGFTLFIMFLIVLSLI